MQSDVIYYTVKALSGSGQGRQCFAITLVCLNRISVLALHGALLLLSADL